MLVQERSKVRGSVVFEVKYWSAIIAQPVKTFYIFTTDFKNVVIHYLFHNPASAYTWPLGGVMVV